MFLRRWDGLPKDVVFETDLKKLGYFVNEDDEVRNIDDPQYYFKYRLDKNERINERQRFHFNLAIEELVHERLEKEGLRKIPLPFGSRADQPNVPIFISQDLAQKSRVVVIFGEPCQQLGHLALRVANNRGGINKGTMVSVVQALKQQKCSALDPDPPGIILANTGEHLWWDAGKKAITLQMRRSMPLPSMVHYGASIQNRDLIRDHWDIQEHIAYVLSKVLRTLTRENCKIDLIGIGSGGDELTMHLDVGGYDRLQNRINTLTLLGTITDRHELKNPSFKTFLATRARTWINSREPLGTPIADHNGNPNTNKVFCDQGTAGVFSAGVYWHIELIFIEALAEILDWIQLVAIVGAKFYKHPEVVVTFADPIVEDCDWSAEAQVDGEANGDATGLGGDGAQDVTPQKPSKVDEHSNSKGGFNFFAENGDETPSPHSEDNQPAPRPKTVPKPNINFFAEVSGGEDDDLDPETKARLNQGIERFLATGSMMDPREEEKIEAEIQDIKDGIAGMY